jgi:hypothetical protein
MMHGDNQHDDFKITWSMHEHEPQSVNLNCPDGTHVDLSRKRRPACVISVPYPAPPRPGLFRIKCVKCGAYAHVPTAGRPDDPRSIRLACRRPEGCRS